MQVCYAVSHLGFVSPDSTSSASSQKKVAHIQPLSIYYTKENNPELGTDWDVIRPSLPMQIKQIEIRNLRSVRYGTLAVGELTALVGANNAGKSTILKAVELFFDPAPKINQEDFSAGFEQDPIEITIDFNNLTPSEVAEFGTAVIDGEMSISRSLSLTDKDSGQYSAKARVSPQFNDIRNETNGTKKRSLFNKLAQDLEGLDPVRSHLEIDECLLAWEKANPNSLVGEKIRGFFGASNVANGKLRKKTSVHLVPAVRDATTETGDPKRSPIISLLSEISKQTFENRAEISEFLQRSQDEFKALTDPERVPELSGISHLLTLSLQRFYLDSKLKAKWEQNEGLSASYPTPRLLVDHKGVTTELSRVGHGLQRAALFSIVQFLAEQVAMEANDENGMSFDKAASDIIVLIEEPEIYQHPNKQIVIYDAFREIVSGHSESTGIRLQIIYTTHSEKFVRMTDFDAARIVRRTEDKEPVTIVSDLKMEDCSKTFANLHDPPKQPMDKEAFVAKLHIFSREVCEGFFAEKVILVEGPTDKAIIDAAYRLQNRNAYEEGISILPVSGKNTLDKPYYIFSKLGIPTYLVFDNDSRKKKEDRNNAIKTNKLLQKLCGIEEPEDWPVTPQASFMPIDGDLETYISSEMGNTYDEIFEMASEQYGLNLENIKKTPAAILYVFMEARKQGISFDLFDEIISRVDAL